MTRATAVLKSVLLGSALGLAVGVVVCLIVMAPATVLGVVTRNEVRDVAVAFLPTGAVAGLVLGCIAPFPQRQRRRALILALLIVYPLSACLSLVLLSTAQHGSFPPIAELLSLKTLVMLAWMAAAYVPIVGGPAAIALILLERRTRPEGGSP